MKSVFEYRATFRSCQTEAEYYHVRYYHGEEMREALLAATFMTFCLLWVI